MNTYSRSAKHSPKLAIGKRRNIEQSGQKIRYRGVSVFSENYFELLIRLD